MPRVAKSVEEIKNEAMQVCIKCFNEKGLKLTMDDIAAGCRVSKKTLYFVFKDKDEMFLAMVDYLFDKIKESEAIVMNDDSLSTVEKLRKLLGVLPEGYQEVDFGQLYSLKEKYPNIYAQVEARLETGWETAIELMKRGMEEGVIKPVHIPIVKLMFEASLEQFFQRDVLVNNKIRYAHALNEVVNIIVDGIVTGKEE